MSLFAANPNENLLPYDGIVNDFGQVFDSPADAPNALYRHFLTQLPWQPDVVTIFGKTHVTHRQIVWMSENDYHYSGQRKMATPWTADVLALKQYIELLLAEQHMSANFNACLFNYYPTGDDGMGYHADNESELGNEPIIASVSLGATRKFVFKHRITKEKVEIPLQNGQLIVMRGQTQRHWLHSLPKTKKVTEGRINLTFRHIAN